MEKAELFTSSPQVSAKGAGQRVLCPPLARQGVQETPPPTLPLLLLSLLPSHLPNTS